MVKQVPIEKFISTKRKQKLSSDEIIRELHNEGYSDIVGLLADHVRGYRIAAYALLLVCLVLAGSTYYLYQRQAAPSLAQIITEQAIIALDPFQCLGMDEKNAREECMTKLKEALAKAVNEESTKLKATIGLGALTDNPSLCANLGDNRQNCETFMQLIKARMNVDPTACPKNDPALQSRCVLDILARVDPGAQEQLREKVKSAIQTAIITKNSLTCQSLPYEFMVEECKLQSSQQLAINLTDVNYCDMIPNDEARRICKSAIGQMNRTE